MFMGRDLDVVPVVLVIDIVNYTTNTTVLAMPYNIVSSYIHVHNLLLLLSSLFDVHICKTIHIVYISMYYG